MVGVDGSDSSLSALRWAVRQAELTGGTVDAVIAWHYPAPVGGIGLAPAAMIDNSDFGEIASRTLADAISQVADPGGRARMRPLVVEGHPAQVLLDAAADADLLVVGSRGHGGFAGALLGSVSQHCTHHASCPVVVIRDRDDE
ncbi:MAG TPA: universal stress protein [Streptosporangiaceae bacterium]